MSGGKMYDKVFAIFGVFMVFFYIGLGVFIIFHPLLNHLDKALRLLFGITLIIYGIYRIMYSYNKIKKSFFSKDDDDE